MRMKVLRNKFVLTDYERASRIVEVSKKLDFVKEVFVIGDKSVAYQAAHHSKNCYKTQGTVKN